MKEEIRDGWKIRWEPGKIGIAVRMGEEFPEDGVIQKTLDDTNGGLGVASLLYARFEMKDGEPIPRLHDFYDYCLLYERRGDDVTFSLLCREISKRESYSLRWPFPESVSNQAAE